MWGEEKARGGPSVGCQVHICGAGVGVPLGTGWGGQGYGRDADEEIKQREIKEVACGGLSTCLLKK